MQALVSAHCLSQLKHPVRQSEKNQATQVLLLDVLGAPSLALHRLCSKYLEEADIKHQGQ